MIFDKIKEILVDELGIDETEITPDTTFAELDIDSLDKMQVIMEIEEALSVTIDEGAEITTIGDLAEYIENNNE